MKKLFLMLSLILSVVLNQFIISCKKDDSPSNKNNNNNNNHTDSLVDRQGNKYKTVTIGTQTWMAENLKVTVYNDGSQIYKIEPNNAWANQNGGCYCNYNNDTSLGNKYGKLYNWTAVEKGKLCPTGWHVPTSEEWSTLENYLMENGYDYDSIKYGTNIGKALASTWGWDTMSDPGSDATVGNNQLKNNRTGFSAQPAGSRYIDGKFMELGQNSIMWSSTDAQNCAYAAHLYYPASGFGQGIPYKKSGLSVRCLKN